MGNICVIGSINMDLVIQTPRWPAPGETVSGEGFMTVPGGKGANQAIAAARLGGTVRMLARVGDDAFGTQLLDNLKASGVNCDDVQMVTETPSGVAVITVCAGENAIILDPGANYSLTPSDVRAFATRIREADMLLVQLEVPLSVVTEAVHVAFDVNTPVLLNPAPAVPLDHDLLQRVTVLTPNRGEAALLAGDTGVDSSVESLIDRLHGFGVETVCMTEGAQGITYRHGGLDIEHRDAISVDVVDTTAAGDVFSGALAVALTEGALFEDAAAFAQKAAAIAVTRAGASSSIPYRAEVESFDA